MVVNFHHSHGMDAQWLKTQFELYPEKTKADLARALSLEPPAISKILAGIRQIKAGEYVGMRRFFGYPTEVGAANSAVEKNYRLEPLQTGMRDRGEQVDQSAWMMPAGLLKQKTSTPPEQIKIFPVEDTSMAPDFAKGEQVLVDISDQKPSPPGVFVISDGVSYMLRRCELMPSVSPASVKISAGVSAGYDPYTISLDKAEIIGRVIAKLEWL